MPEVDRIAIAAEVRRVLATMVLPAGRRGPPGFDGKDADPEEIRGVVAAEIRQAMAAIRQPRDGAPGQRGEPGLRGADGIPVPAQLPVRAEFERDPVTKLTLAVHVEFTGDRHVDIVPIHDEDGFMLAADFLAVT